MTTQRHATYKVTFEWELDAPPRLHLTHDQEVDLLDLLDDELGNHLSGYFGLPSRGVTLTLIPGSITITKENA